MRADKPNKLVVGLPKGSLQEATLQIFEKAGWRIRVDDRSYFPEVDDEEMEVVLLRPQEIPIYVANGRLDMGITGYDWVMESQAGVSEVAELVYAKQGFRPVRWVVAVATDSPFHGVRDLDGHRIATELVNVTREFLYRHGISAGVDFSYGATEAKPGLGLADAIVDLTETGSSLRRNGLRVLDTVLESTTRVIANSFLWQHGSDHDLDKKRAKIDEVVTMLQSVIAAAARVTLSMNVPAGALKAVRETLPADINPTVSTLADGGQDIMVVVQRDVVRGLIPRLKAAGAGDIIESPLNKFVE